jgi:hypothetical protein
MPQRRMPMPIDELQMRLPHTWQQPVVRVRPRLPDGWPGPPRRSRIGGRRGINVEMQEGIHSETPEQYQARLNSYLADRDPIEMLRAAPDVLAGLIEGAPDALLNRRPTAGKWSVCDPCASGRRRIGQQLALRADDRAQRYNAAGI